MPIAVDPQQTADFALAIDAGLPDAERPTFTTRFLTCREVLKVDRLIDEAAKLLRDAEAENALLNRILAISATGWRNITDRDKNPVAFKVETVEVNSVTERTINVLDDVLTPTEKWELVTGLLRAVRLQEDDRKKSASEQATASAQSARPAPAAVA